MTAAVRPPRTLFGHPPGLTVLFLTQMWAEFSYFGLQALLVYYMTQQLHFSQAKSSLVYGSYTAAAFFTPFFGGIVADRWLGRTRSVVIGGTLMMVGHFAMASEALLFPALVLVAVGNGLFVPPLAVQVGHLYEGGDPRKAHAFSVYYMGINLGGLLAPLVCGTLGETLGWHWGFAAAGVGMALGLAVYLAARATLPPELGTAAGHTAAPVAAMTALDWRRLRLLAGIVAAVVLFRIGYEQSGNVIALWIRDDTDRTVALAGTRLAIPATWFQSLNPLLIIVLTPVLIRLWRAREQARGGANLLRRMSAGCAVAGLSLLLMVAAAQLRAVTGHTVGPGWVAGYFVLLTVGELMVIPVGLTLVEQLSPAQVASMAMGGWYLAKFAGGLLAGTMGVYWGQVPATVFFGLGAAAVFAGAGVLWLMARLSPVQPG